MENRFINKVKDNAAVRIWAKTTHREKGNSFMEGYVSELWYFTRISYWNTTYSCFTFEKVDLVPTVEEYTTLLLCPKIQADKAYSRAVNVLTFLKKLTSITRISEQWVTAWIK
ncbi:hypothetical protein Goshw_023358 [Gossypium schwendimanii]|uniref:DUF7745 domain-containing protein n=1 Tax=Gossypium schwendimanii TaxID=34291 RepID=A0A7J9KYY2_GOSSC|nr:hypothetical protein [Gossypium schwendimanii]